MADRKNFLQVIAAVILGEETPVLIGKYFGIHHQCIALEFKTFGQVMGFDCLLVDGGQKQWDGTDHKGRRLWKQIQIVGDGAAQGVDLISLWWQFDRLIALAATVFGEEADRAVARVERGAEQFIIEGAQVSELDACSAWVLDRLIDPDAFFQLFLCQRRTLEPGRGVVVIDHHRQVQRLDGFRRGASVEAQDRQVQVLAGYRNAREIQQADLKSFDRPVEINLGVVAFLLFLEVLLLFIELFFQRLAPELLLLHLRQLFLVEGNLCGGLIDRA
ncbi:hypothetical protein D3C76_1050720 [compost metagenome]